MVSTVNEVKSLEINKELIDTIVKELDFWIVGQENYKNVLATEIYLHIRENARNPILIIGPTGSGKSYFFTILENIAKKLENYTIYKANVAMLTEAGVKGEDMEDIFKEFDKKCRAENNKLRRGIIYFDEVDKIIMRSTESYNSNNAVINRGEEMQHQIMKFIDGERIGNVETRNILPVFGGTFYGMEKLEEKKNEFGFLSAGQDTRIMASKTIREKLYEVGINKEFLGRITNIVTINALDKYELKALLIHPQEGVICKLKESYLKDDIELEVDENAIDCLVEAVIKEGLGARSIKNVLIDILQGTRAKCIREGYSKIIIDKDTVYTGELKFV